MPISNIEKKAVLELTKYFGNHWTIIDIGSNKGQWSDILIEERDSSYNAGKYVVYMVEPNEMLLNYTKVKYDYNDNINYLPHAVFNESDKEIDFWYWENCNSGLSSVYLNKKWEEEVGKFRKCKKVRTITIDSFIDHIAFIDIIKIDVEGAEYDVLLGAERVLREKAVKFFQIEYSEHYKLANKGFRDIIKYINQFGYSAWSFDGEYFNKLTEENFVEDYRLENFYITYLEIGKYHYTQLWNKEFINNTANISKFNFGLEIGCFEGLTSNYICDNLLLPGGRIICIDPLEDLYLHDADEETNKMFVGQYDRFIKNTKGQPIELIRKKSYEAWSDLKDYLFDFVYIDGDHSEEAVYNDGKNVFELLRIDGHILFDDYEWREETKSGIDKFLKEYKDRIEILIKDYQVLIKKIQ